MRAIVKSHGQASANLHKGFWVAIRFLEERLAERERSRLLAVVPEKGTRRDMGKCVAECRKITHTAAQCRPPAGAWSES